MLDGLFGTVFRSIVSVENVGLFGLSRVGSRKVVQISATFMLFFSILDTSSYFRLQCIHEHRILVASDSGTGGGGVSGQYDRGGEIEERSRDAMAGEVQNIQRR
ncbi:hypothetical protein V6N11_081915 [Hibiscus sabdariffa]|uniref:Uncharacterized protein n=1 Tax=Hibiscus sabdariffa TaxID=183260 RepID=A0ABR2Q7Y3_9ROSI